jgi:hypothetical protein
MADAEMNTPLADTSIAAARGLTLRILFSFSVFDRADNQQPTTSSEINN